MKIIGNTVKTPLNPNKFGIDEEKLAEGLATKVDKTDEKLIVYGTTGKGEQTTYKVTQNVEEKTVVQRRAAGHIVVPTTPNEATAATSKQYVDKKDDEIKARTEALTEKQTKIEERVANLENLTLDYPEDSTVAYEKIVPANVGNPAFIDSVGGATERVASKNILNPRDIGLEDYSYSTQPDVTFNDDGTITYTAYTLSSWVWFNIYPRPIGRYYIFVEGAHDNAEIVREDTGFVEIQCNVDVDENDNPIPTTSTLKVMLWKDESVTTDTYELVKVYDVDFEPYFEPYFINADVERIDSLSKNRLPNDVYDVNSWVKNAEDNFYSYYLDFLSDGWYCFSAKLKEEHKNNIYFYLQKSVDGGITYETNKSAYRGDGYVTNGHYITNTGISSTAPFWFKVDKKAGTVYRLVFNYITQEKLNMIYNIQIERANLTQEPSNPSYKPDIYSPVTEYSPYKSEPIDTITIHEAVKLKGVNDTYYDYIEHKDDKWLYHKVCEEIVLNGTENWAIFHTDTINQFYFYPLNNFKGMTSEDGIVKTLNLRYRDIPMLKRENNYETLYTSTSGFCINTLAYETVEEFKSYLASEPLTVRYALATPEVEDITHLFPKGNQLYIERGGIIRFVNEHEMPVPSTVGYVTRKE